MDLGYKILSLDDFIQENVYPKMPDNVIFFKGFILELRRILKKFGLRLIVFDVGNWLLDSEEIPVSKKEIELCVLAINELLKKHNVAMGCSDGSPYYQRSIFLQSNEHGTLIDIVKITQDYIISDINEWARLFV